MNKLRSLLLGLLLIVSTALQAQVYTASSLPRLLAKAEQDSISRIERLAAMEFHRIINEYRKENDLDQLMWDDTLWLTCRNHNIWMAANNELSHGENEGTAMYTGSGPGARYRYASQENGATSWSGENALYNWSVRGDDMAEIASYIAEYSFNQWKNSKGHDQNMRKPGSKIHGVAFTIEDNGQVWGTDMFGYLPYYMREKNENDNNVFVFNTPKRAQQSKKLNTGKPASRVRFTMGDKKELEQDILANLGKEQKGSPSKSMNKAASGHAKYLAFTNDLGSEQKRHMPGYMGKTPRARMIKATWGLHLFTKRKYELSESVAMVKSNIFELDSEFLSDELEAKLEAEKEIQGETVRSAYGVYVRRVKGEVKVYAVLLETIDPTQSEDFAFLPLE